jgi:transposase
VNNATLTKEQFKKILEYLQSRNDVYIASRAKIKRFLNAILWITRSGAQWRLLPKSYGDWNSIFQRYNRWSKKGIWQDLFEHFAQDPDMQSVMIDATIARAHSSSPVKGGI